MMTPTAFMLLGLYAWSVQLRDGLAVTGQID